MHKFNSMIKKAQFIISNTDFRKCPSPHMPEFAFIGRSNVGKSSLINMLTQNKNLAKTSGTPGKTQLINHFGIDNRWYMVDLPGYGFAKVGKTVKSSWENMIRGYLTHRENLVATFVLIDSRLDPQQIDLEFILWCAQNEVPIVLAFTKADKIARSSVQANVAKFLKATQEIYEEPPLHFVSSAENMQGRDEIVSFIEEHTEEFYKQNQRGT